MKVNVRVNFVYILKNFLTTFSPKTLTANVLNHDHDYTVDVLFSNDDDDDGDVQTLGKFSVENPNGHL